MKGIALRMSRAAVSIARNSAVLVIGYTNRPRSIRLENPCGGRMRRLLGAIERLFRALLEISAVVAVHNMPLKPSRPRLSDLCDAPLNARRCVDFAPNRKPPAARL